MRWMRSVGCGPDTAELLKRFEKKQSADGNKTSAAHWFIARFHLLDPDWFSHGSMACKAFLLPGPGFILWVVVVGRAFLAGGALGQLTENITIGFSILGISSLCGWCFPSHKSVPMSSGTVCRETQTG